MLNKIKIKNFKSILDDTISLGRINVFIGENGSGKSNILEALTFASVAETYDTIDPDILYANGFRVAKPSLILNSFRGKKQRNTVEIDLEFSKDKMSYKLIPKDNNNIFSKWINSSETLQSDFIKTVRRLFEEDDKIPEKLKERYENDKEGLFLLLRKKFTESFDEVKKKSGDYSDLSNYIIYTLNTEALRGIPEFQKSRKGIYGETLDILIGSLTEEELIALKKYVYTLSWLDGFFIDSDDNLKKLGYKLNRSKSLLYFKDKYMMTKNNIFSSENSNEGILHILFYLSTIISSKTPRLFAIDNIETSLNPHLCRHTMEEICELSEKYDKQILITTHNPAILDGLDLFDNNIRLFEVLRTDNGDTKTRRIKIKPEIQDKSYKLSELWTNGFLGAISQKF